MNRLRVVVVDDEPLGRRGVRQLLANEDDIEIIGEARSGEEAIHILRTARPDLVFLDVQMPEVDGFEVIRRLGPDAPGGIIFVTAHDAYAVQAFEEHALDYLLKPLQKQRFQQTLRRARTAIDSSRALALSAGLSKLLAEQGQTIPPLEGDTFRQSLHVTSGRSDFFVPQSNIEWIEADNYYAALHTNGRRHLVRTSLSALHKKLDRKSFVRVHRAAIVNLAYIHELRPASGDLEDIVLTTGETVRLSRRRRGSLARALKQFRSAPNPLPAVR